MRQQVRRVAIVGVLLAMLLGLAIQSLVAGTDAEAQTAPASDAPRTIAATGVGEVPVDGVPNLGGTVNINVQERATIGNLVATVQKVQSEVKGITDGVQRAGVAPSAVHVVGFNISPNFGGCCYAVPAMGSTEPGRVDGVDGNSASGGGVAVAPPMPAVAPNGSAPSVILPVPPGPPFTAGYVVTANVQVDTTSPEQMAVVVQAAVALGGVTSVNTYVKGGPQAPIPGAGTLDAAIRQATEQAKGMAAASATAAGVKLGAIRSVKVDPPTGAYTSPGGQPNVWRVQVTISYDIVP